MALLEGDIAKAIYAGFRGKLLKGTLTRTVPGGGLDAHGDPIASTVASFPCEGFVENFSAFYRAQAGIPDTDVKVLIFAQSITTVPTKDDVITFRGTKYQIRRILEIDPAVATYQLQGYKP